MNQYFIMPLYTQIRTEEEMQFADAFILQVVNDSDIQNFNFAAGVAPFLQKAISFVCLGYNRLEYFSS